MTDAQVAAVTIWIVAAGFGLPALPVARHLLKHGELPVVFGAFHPYGGTFQRLRPTIFALLLGVFGIVMCFDAYIGFQVWQGSNAAAVWALAIVPFEALFWIGFALPLPPLFALARVVLLIYSLSVR